MRLTKIKNKLSWPISSLKYRGLRGVKSQKDFYKVIEHERERANRNNHKVSLVVFNLESFPNDGKERKQLLKNILQEKRRIDEIGWYKKDRVGVILPYTSSRGARKFSVRLSGTLNFIMPDSFCHLFTYPLEDKADDHTEHTDIKEVGSVVGVVKNDNDDVECTDDDKNKVTEYAQTTSVRSVAQ